MQEYYKPLDAIRGLLALAVAFYHCEWVSIWTVNSFVENGYLAVDVFFCLSGFLMFRLYSEMSSMNEGHGFLVKRFARIYPLHLFTLIAMLLFILVRFIAIKLGAVGLDEGEVLPLSLAAPDNIYSFFSNVALLQSMGLHDHLSFIHPAWSISVEFYTYIVFAALVIFFPIKKTLHFIIIAATGVGIYAALAMVKPDLDITYDYGFFRCLAGFASGIIACWLFVQSKPLFERLSHRASSIIEAIIAIVFIAWFCLVDGALTFTIAPMMTALIIIFAHGKGSLSSIMSLAPFQYLGKISYSVYLNHFLIVNVMGLVSQRVFGGYETMGVVTSELTSLVYLGLILISSHITYHIVEKPSAKYLRNKFVPAYTKQQQA